MFSSDVQCFKRPSLVAFCLPFLWVCNQPLLAQAPPRYTVTDLGSLGGQESDATGMNNKGQIIGGADTAKHGKGPEFLTDVFVWQNGKMRPVPGLDGTHAFVVAVNNAEQMAGAYSPDPLKSKFAAALFTLTGKVRLLNGFPARQQGYSLSEAEAVNSKGQAVGISNNQAFLWSAGKLRRLAPPPGFTAADAGAINDAGEAAGKANRVGTGKTSTHALLWNAAGKARDLGILPGYTDSIARGINNKGQIAGWVGVSGGTTGHGLTFHYQAFLWQNGKMRGLGSIPRLHDSKASGLNDKGQVVGNAYYKTDEAALLWQNGKVYELNTLVSAHSGWKLQNALVINNQGWIAGNGIHNGIRRGFVLIPAASH
ncbi:MAG: hypothetical protein ACRYFS_11090 [Janthinobacterium lividum]